MSVFVALLLTVCLFIVVKEEDILDLLEQCELDDEKLMGKSSKQKGPKVTTHPS